MITNLFLLTAITCFIIGVSGITEQIKRSLFKAVYPGKPFKPFSLKPFDCTLCMTWWAGLVYITLHGCFNLPHIALVALLSLLSEQITQAMYLLKDLIGTLLNKITDKL